MTDSKLLNAIDRATEALESRHQAKWILGFSGGKDSTASLKILLSAMRRAKNKPTHLEIIYCDTGVENPILDRYVKTLLTNLECEADQHGLPIKCRLLKSPLHDRFFVKIIGRGYPPPNNNFRWCTNGLRIRPVSNYIKTQNPENTVLALGIRKSESVQRDRTLKKQKNLYWQKQTEGNSAYDIYAPIVELAVDEVWDAIFCLEKPISINPKEIEMLYRDASGECPIIKSPAAPPCASGRFGCWTCTVVRKDRSALKLLNAGYSQLKPYIDFRNWLVEIRNDPERRWKNRRSGAEGMGPFTLEARREILGRLNDLEDEVGLELLDSDERGAIAGIWKLDYLPRLVSPKT